MFFVATHTRKGIETPVYYLCKILTLMLQLTPARGLKLPLENINAFNCVATHTRKGIETSNALVSCLGCSTVATHTRKGIETSNALVSCLSCSTVATHTRKGIETRMTCFLRSQVLQSCNSHPQGD